MASVIRVDDGRPIGSHPTVGPFVTITTDDQRGSVMPPIPPRRGLVIAVCCLLGFVALAGCSGAGGAWLTMSPTLAAVADPAPEALPITSRTTVDDEGKVITTPQVEVRVPAGAVASGQHIDVLIGTAAGKRSSEVFGTPVGVDHNSPLSAPVRLNWSIKDLNAEQRASLILARWKPGTATWEWVDATFSISGDNLITDVQEFSFWTWIADAGQWVGEHTGSRAAEPKCNGRALPSWVKDFVDPDQDTSAAAIRVCFEPDRADIVTVRVVNNRTFSQRLKMTNGDQTWSWTWPGNQTLGVSGLVYLAARPLFDSPTTFLVPPLTEVTLGIDRPSTPGQLTITATSYVDIVTILIDVVTFALDNLHIDIAKFPTATAFVQAMLECGAKQIGDRPTQDGAESVVQAVLSAVGGCAGELVRPASTFGARFEELVQKSIRSSPSSAEDLAKGYRAVHEIAGKFALLQVGAILFNVSDQITNSFVGPLAWSIRGNGRAQQLGAWQPTCSNTKTDSNLLYRNIALQDEFSDTSRELWQFPGWDAAARAAVAPLARCSADYLRQLAAFVPGNWGDRKAAGVVAAKISALIPATPTQPKPVTSTTRPSTTPGPPKGGPSVTVVSDACPHLATYGSQIGNTVQPDATSANATRGPLCVQRVPAYHDEVWSAAWLDVKTTNHGTVKYIEVIRHVDGQWSFWVFKNNVVPSSSPVCTDPPDAIQNLIGCP